jgi:hypothetical protein
MARVAYRSEEAKIIFGMKLKIMNYFEYETVARAAGISSEKLEQLVKLFNSDEPNDPMLAELHILRACMAIKSGRVSLTDAIKEAQKLTAKPGNN